MDLITKPSIDEMIAGLIRNFEKLSGEGAAGAQQLLTPALAVLDRIDQEWHSWSALLAADNADIRATLQGLSVEPGVAATDLAALAGGGSRAVLASLEEENRALKRKLVEVIEQFDLPPAEHAAASIHEADAAVLGLLRRILHREDSVQVPAPRSAATGGNPANATVSLDELQAVLERFLEHRMPAATDIMIQDLQPLAGGASREAWIFDVSWREAGRHHEEPCILMREPVASVLVSDSAPTVIDGTRRTVETEIRVVQAMEKAGFPVPTVLWYDANGEWLERPFSIARRLPGTADVAELLETQNTGAILNRFIDLLAQLHAMDPGVIGVDFLGTPVPENAAAAQIAQFERNFERQRLEAFPATSYLIRWLKKHAPRADRVSVVHGDYRLGNFLFDDDGIIAILDWEQVHVGDPVEEIAFMYWSVWSLEGICPIDEFVRRYEQASGCSVDRQTLAYYRMFIEFKMLVVLFTGLKAYFATPEYQLHYSSATTPLLIRQAQLRAIEALCQGGPTVAFDAYVQRNEEREHG